MLCTCCQRLQNLDLLLQVKSIDHHESLVALVRAANDGCELCASLIKACKSSVHENYSRVIEFPKLSDEKAPEGKTQITWRNSIGTRPYWSIEQTDHPTGLRVYLEPFTDQNDPLSATFPGRPIQEDVRSEQCFQMIKTWMATCQKSHPDCNSPPQPLPSRVIDVGLKGATPRLHLSSPSEVSPWVTLSHCWGGESPLTTTLATLQKHCDSIQINSLPPVFRDAVDLTRILGLRYLWIDSLCIIQDSHADWALESTKMHSIYSGATLCIAASAAQGSSEGMFASGNRSRPMFQPLVTILCYNQIYTKKGLVSFRQYPEGNAQGDTKLWEEPLHTRAWVLQESILSARRIDFGSTKLHWACRQSLCTESFPETSRAVDPYYLTGKDLFSMPIAITPHPSCPIITYGFTFDSPMAWWYGALKQFIARNITNRGDLLPAIAGIAIIIKERTGYNYVCGLWKEDLHRGLLWTSRRSASRLKDDPVPSWSWASLNIPQHHVQLALEKYEQGHKAEIMGYCIKTVGNIEFAPVVRAEITIRGNSLTLLSSTWKYVSGGTGLLSNTMQLVSNWVPNVETAHKVMCRLDEEDVTRMSYRDLVDRQVICMQVAMFSTTRWKRKMVKEETVFGLLLERTDKVMFAYRRIGVVEIPKLSGLADGWMERSVTIV